MIKLPFELGCYLMKHHYNIFGYFCNQGAVVDDNEFIIYSDDKDYYLAHISEFEQEGVLIRLKEKK